MSDEPIYTAGSELTLSIPLVDEAGVQIDPASYTYTLYNEAGVSVDTGSGTMGGGQYEQDLTIAAGFNQLSAGVRTGARQLVMIVTDDDGRTHTLQQIYMLQAAFVPLSIPDESGQTLLQASILSKTLASQVIESFQHSDIAEQEAALLESWNRLSNLAYEPWREEDTPDINLSDTVRSSNFVLNEITNADWLLLPNNFKNALMRAQLIEASVLLGGDPTWERLQDGLSSKTVGESSEVFRGRPSKSTISPKARREIAGYIRQSLSIGRA